MWIHRWGQVKGDGLLAGLLAAGMLAVTFICSLVVDRSIFGLAIWSFTGFASLFPVLVGERFWRRAMAAGVIASILTVAALWVGVLTAGWSVPNYSVLGIGLKPVVATVIGGSVSLFLVSLMTRPVADDVLDRVFCEEKAS